MKARAIFTLVISVLFVTAVSAQETYIECSFLCAPSLKIEPTVTFEPIFGRPEIENLADGTILSSVTEATFELILAVGIPTEIPRVGFTVETIFIPTGTIDRNPFTGQTALEAGQATFRGNEIEFELELNLSLVEPEQTGGWIDSHFDIVDKFSAAERPGDSSSYTHKLNLEWDTAFLAFQWLPEDNWWRNVEIEGSLDYVATGLPRLGDVVNGERFLTDDNPWSFSIVFVFPLAPLSP